MFAKLKKLLGLDAPSFDGRHPPVVRPEDTPLTVHGRDYPDLEMSASQYETDSVMREIDWKDWKYKSIKIDLPNDLSDNFEVKAWDGRSWVVLHTTADVGDALQTFRSMFQPTVFISSDR